MEYRQDASQSAGVASRVITLARIVVAVSAALELDETAAAGLVSSSMDVVPGLDDLRLDAAVGGPTSMDKSPVLAAFVEKFSSAREATKLQFLSAHRAQWLGHDTLKECWCKVAASALKAVRHIDPKAVQMLAPTALGSLERVKGLLFQICEGRPLCLTQPQILDLLKAAERRVEKRASSWRQYMVWIGNRPMKVDCLNESSNGCCVAADLPVRIGAKVEIQALMGPRRSCRVRWRSGGQTGLQFVSELRDRNPGAPRPYLRFARDHGG